MKPDVGEDLRRRPEAGRVGHRPRHDADEHVEIEAEGEEDDDRHRHAEADDRHRGEVEAQPVGAEALEEPGADLDADGVDEQDQPELAHEMHHFRR